MPRNLDENRQCQTCFHHFPNDKELHQHIETYQSRLQHLLSRAQILFAAIKECSAHSNPRHPDGDDRGPFDAFASPSSSSDDDADNLVNNGGNGLEKLMCLHEECMGKPKTEFKEWKYLVRHYSIHVQCHETCGFCGIEIQRVRKYVTHFESCKMRKGGKRSPDFISKEIYAIERRRTLNEMASKELRLKGYSMADSPDDAISPQETAGRKQESESAVVDPENLFQTRQRRIVEDDGGTTVAFSSGSSHQTPSTTEHVATEIAAPAKFGMPPTNALILTHHAMAPLPSHYDEPQGEVLNEPRKRRRVSSFPPSNENGGFIVTPVTQTGITLPAETVSSINSSVSRLSSRPVSDQGGTTEETSPGHVDFGAPQARDDCRVEQTEMNVAEVAEVGGLVGTLGDYLYEGMDKTQIRHREKEKGMVSFTQAVRLHFGYCEGEDFKLEVWLCSSVGKAISQAKTRSFEDLRNMLGDYLFEHMKASNWRKEEERKGISDCTGAVSVSFPNGEDCGDCILGVMLNFAVGMSVFESIYPRLR